MTHLPASSRQPLREPWTRDRLLWERAIAIASAVDMSSTSSYSSALNSYINFCTLHNFPIEPSPDTLSFYVVFMCHHIKPKSVDSYLSGICNLLEPFFPNVRIYRRDRLVIKTIQGCKKLHPSTPLRRRPLSRSDLQSLSHLYPSSASYNDKLFMVLLFTGFHGLMRLGELVWPDQKKLHDFRKVICRNTVRVNQNSFEFYLPGHKADRFFDGNLVIIQSTRTPDDPFSRFTSYITIRDEHFPFRSELWLKEDGSIPTRSWFMHHLHRHFPADIGGHSMQAGGATAFAEAGIAPSMIQAIGRWSSEAFQIYIRQHPVLLAMLLHGQPTTAS
jgi:hypothetical protein